MHTNVLQLQHLIKELDESTITTENFTGLIGQQLASCEQLDIVGFKVADAPEITTDGSDLSCDPKYLLSMFKSVRIGSVSTPDFTEARTHQPLMVVASSKYNVVATDRYFPIDFSTC